MTLVNVCGHQIGLFKAITHSICQCNESSDGKLRSRVEGTVFAWSKSQEQTPHHGLDLAEYIIVIISQIIWEKKRHTQKG